MLYETGHIDEGDLRHWWKEWLRRADELGQQILLERGGEPLDIELVVQAAKDELEARNDYLFYR
jgi:hypothetical protein